MSAGEVVTVVDVFVCNDSQGPKGNTGKSEAHC